MSEGVEGRTEIACFEVVDEQSRTFCGSELKVVGAEMRNPVVPIFPVTRSAFFRSLLCTNKLTRRISMKFAGGKGKGLDTCYSATYMSQTCDQQRFTISVVAADWHEPMVSQRIMWPSIARDNGQLDLRCS